MSRTQNLAIRIGIDCGEVIAGVIGKLQPRFHAQGAVVASAQKLEGRCLAGSVLISSRVADLVPDVVGNRLVRTVSASQLKVADPGHSKVASLPKQFKRASKDHLKNQSLDLINQSLDFKGSGDGLKLDHESSAKAARAARVGAARLSLVGGNGNHSPNTPVGSTWRLRSTGDMFAMSGMSKNLDDFTGDAAVHSAEARRAGTCTHRAM
jgi:hypothetical protein